MAYTPKDGSITVFKNSPEPGSRQPHLTGNGMFAGKEVRIALWPATNPDGTAKKDKKGNTYMTGSLKLADEDGPRGGGAGGGAKPKKEDDGDFFN